MFYTELMKNAWSSLYDSQKNVTNIIDEFFHQDYFQCINGIKMNREEYTHHVLEQKKNMMIHTIDYVQVLEKENELFAIYYPKGTNIQNMPIEAEVIAYFRFENKKIINIRGLVRLIKGDLTDVDMISEISNS